MIMKKMIRIRHLFPMFISLLCLTAGFASCTDEDDGYTYPPLLSEFADVCTDEAGLFTYLLADNGERFCIVNSTELKADSVTPDTIYRTISRYERVEGGIKLYSMQAISASPAVKSEAFADGVKADPVEMQSIWRGGSYLNMILLVKSQNKRHAFHFVEDTLTTSPTGTRILRLRLSHDAGDDLQAYTQKAYLSLPLSPYSSLLVPGDSILLSIPTTRGWEQWARRY